jgi:hypothetical protein
MNQNSVKTREITRKNTRVSHIEKNKQKETGKQQI